MTFADLYLRYFASERRPPHFRGRLLALDPGETTGVAIFDTHTGVPTLMLNAQYKTWPPEEGVPVLESLLAWQPNHVVYERYAIYRWHKDDHVWSDVPTLQLIGCIRTCCIQRRVSYSDQTAQNAKGFSTDGKLEEWGLYNPSLRHGRDAIRHACHYLLFGKPMGGSP